MDKMFLGKVLMSFYDSPSKPVAETELEPIKPGAWAAWAEGYRDAQAATAAAPSAAKVSGRVADPFTPGLAPDLHRG
jgi:hypothetical protein